MTDEEMNKKMEFIVEHQAKFAAELEMMREVQAADTNHLTNLITGVIEIIGSLARSTDDRINSLRDAQARTEKGIQRLTEAQARTDERLNIFINVVERYISGNAGASSPA